MSVITIDYGSIGGVNKQAFYKEDSGLSGVRKGQFTHSKGDDLSSYYTYNSSTNVFTVVKKFTALISIEAYNYATAGDGGSQINFYKNDTVIGNVKVESASCGASKTENIPVNFNVGDTFYPKRDVTTGNLQMLLGIYICPSLSTFVNDMYADW